MTWSEPVKFGLVGASYGPWSDWVEFGNGAEEPPPPPPAVPPMITVTPVEGQPLPANPGQWAGNPPLEYQWQWASSETDPNFPPGAGGARRVVPLVEAVNLTVLPGLELLDSEDRVVDDITDHLVGGVVERGNYRTIHGTCRLSIDRRLDWGADRVRPYVTLTDGVRAERHNLGVYLLTTPSRVAGTRPQTWDVEGYDKLEVLNHPPGRTFVATAGESALGLIRDTIRLATSTDSLWGEGGDPKVAIAGLGSDVLVPSHRIWMVGARDGGDEAGDVTWLRIVNELLAMIGYRGVWVDRNGWFRSAPYVSPVDQAPMWTYDTSSAATTVGPERSEEADFFRTPNRWEVVRDDPSLLLLPSDGDGIVVLDNVDQGPTSQQARRRIISRTVHVQASSQQALEARARQLRDTDSHVHRYLELMVGPNPNHFHFDVVRVIDPELDANGRWAVQSWSLPLDGGWMRLRARAV
jgi:hypothetical protein